MPKALPPTNNLPNHPEDPRTTLFCYALLSLAPPADAVVAFGVRLINEQLSKRVRELLR